MSLVEEVDETGGFVRLVSYMQPAPPVESETPQVVDFGWTGDLEIVRNARVSYNADWRTGEDEGKDEKLLKYLIAHNHTTPLEAMVFTFEIKAPIFVIRQWHRHRTWSYNEVSARYTTLDEGFYVPPINAIGKGTPKNKQARDIHTDLTVEETEIRRVWQNDMRTENQVAFDFYKKSLEAGIPRELARTILPLNAYSRFFGTVDLHNLFHFCRLRLDAHAQHEIQQYAYAMLKLIKPVVPIAVEAFWDSTAFEGDPA